MSQLTTFLKFYLSMETWFHDDNPKEKVRAAHIMIAQVIYMMIAMFPPGGNGWNLPKLHGLTKVQNFIILFGCTANSTVVLGNAVINSLSKTPGTTPK